MKRSKKILKEKILQQTGIFGNEKEEKVKIAEEILSSSELKQDLCNDHPGLDFGFIEKIMKEVIRNNKIKNTDADKLEVVQEDDLPISSYRKKRTLKVSDRTSKVDTTERQGSPTPMGHYTPEETAALIKASK